ncbi:MAG: DUF4350 domain-containing protein [Planctomycetota bacterium]
MFRGLIAICLIFLFCCRATAQQVPEGEYVPEVQFPTFLFDAGPRVAIDEAHFNFHTVDGRYEPFANLLRRDGYRVNGLSEAFTSATLQTTDILVIVNAVNEQNESDWSLPTPSAFTDQEIAAVKCWVCNGGSLFLIADHMPFPGAAADLGATFGVQFSNGYARPGHYERGATDTFDSSNGLWQSEITLGRAAHEAVSQVATFGGSAFIPPINATPVILFEYGSMSYETTKAPGISDDAAEIPVEGWCQGAVFQYGMGRVAVFGEAAMFSAQLSGRNKRPMGMNAPEASQNHQLALNVMHWLSGLYDVSPQRY